MHFLFFVENSEKHFEKVHFRHFSSEHIFDSSRPGNQIKTLENHPNLTAEFTKILPFQGIYIYSVNRQSSCCNVMHAVDAAKDCAFPCPTQTNNCNKFSLFYPEINIFQSSKTVRISLIDIFKFNHVQLFSFICILFRKNALY